MIVEKYSLSCMFAHKTLKIKIRISSSFLISHKLVSILYIVFIVNVTNIVSSLYIKGEFRETRAIRIGSNYYFWEIASCL